jgi:hypothetical protein
MQGWREHTCADRGQVRDGHRGMPVVCSNGGAGCGSAADPKRQGPEVVSPASRMLHCVCATKNVHAGVKGPVQ